MDLTRLYNLTTPELRDEAERLGVSDTYAMSRGQLIHAIRNRVAGPPSEGLLGKVLGIAKWALQPRREEEPKRFGKPSDAPVPSVSAERNPTESPASVPAPVSVPPSASVPVPAPVPLPRSVPGSGQAVSSPAETAAEPPSGPPGRPPAGVFSKSAGMFEEPFPTRTMARILADQGHFKRSIAIYAALLRDEPGNQDLRAEADEVRARSRARRLETH
ncbi:MAG: hypothetical protein WCE62_09010 [Polyangiales bacterium]